MSQVEGEEIERKSERMSERDAAYYGTLVLRIDKNAKEDILVCVAICVCVHIRSMSAYISI